MAVALTEAKELLRQLETARSLYVERVLPMVGQELPPEGLEIVERIAREARFFFLSLPKSLAFEASLNEIPKWKDRQQVLPGLDSLSWFERFWAPLFRAGLVYQEEFRKADTPLFNALNMLARSRGESISTLVPSRQPRKRIQPDDLG